MIMVYLGIDCLGFNMRFRFNCCVVLSKILNCILVYLIDVENIMFICYIYYFFRMM